MGYMASHNRTRKVRGSARDQLCGCGKSAAEWALKHDAPGVVTDTNGKTFSDNPDDYAAMCFRCHRLYDKSAITTCPKGHAYSGDNLIWDAGKRKCRACVYARNAARRRANPPTPEQHARRMEQQRERRRRAREEGTA